MTPTLSRRRLLAVVGAGLGTLAGCGYRPGGGDVRWETGVGTGGYRPDDVVAAGDDETLFTVNRSSRGFDWETEEWGEYADLAAYDAASGEGRGEARTEPVGGPAVSEGTLYVGHEGGGFTAFGSDGAVRWRVETDGFLRTLAAAADRVYGATDGGDLAAFAADDGESLWSTDLGAVDDRVELAAAGDGAYVHRERVDGPTVVAAFAPDGQRRWSATLSVGARAGIADPVVADDSLYVPTGEKLFALALRDGTERWSRGVGSRRGSPAVAGDAVYHADDETVYALDTADGEERWRFRPTGRRARVSPPAATEGRVYVGGDDALYALEAGDGSVRWRVDSDRMTAAPTVVGRTVVVATRDGYLRGHWRE